VVSGVGSTLVALIGVLSAGWLWSCSGRSIQPGEGPTDGGPTDGGSEGISTDGGPTDGGSEGSSTDGGPTDGGPTGSVSQGDFLRKVADAICENVGACCAAANIPYDRAGCEAFVLRDGLVLTPPPHAIWDGVEAAKCVESYVRSATTCYRSRADDSACDHIYRGTLPEGAACIDSKECADIRGTEAACSGTTPTTVRCIVVEWPVRGRAGDACKDTCIGAGCLRSASGASSCYLNDGLVCSSSLGVCVPLPGLGEPCNDLYCAAGLHCSTLDSVCQATRPNGEFCESDQECSEETCVDSQCRGWDFSHADVCGQ
jgi:hypothetical protein